MNFGESFVAAVREYLRENGLTSLGQINAKILQEVASRHFDFWQQREDPPKPARSKTAAPKIKKEIREELYAALVAGCGLDYAKMTTTMKATTGCALNEILAVEPKLTRAMLAESFVRYKAKFPHSSEFSPKAIAKWWPSLMGTRPTQSSRRDLYVEPAGWGEYAKKKYGAEVGQNMIELGWPNLSTDYRRSILNLMP